MQKYIVIISFIAYCESAAYSGSGVSIGGGGGGGYGGGNVAGYGGGSAGFSGGPITAAVETHRTVEVRPVQIPSEPAQPQVIEVPSEELPVTVHFKSQSSRVFVQQTHIPGVVGETEHTSSEDEPHRVVHEVVKPVIQEVREIIQPYRRLVQQIQPVIEQTHTVIAKGEPRGQPILQGPQVGSIGLSGGSGAVSGGYSFGGGSAGSSFGGSHSLSSLSGGGGSSYSSRSGILSSSHELGSTSTKGGSSVSISRGAPSVKYVDVSSVSGSDSVSSGKSYKSAASRARA